MLQLRKLNWMQSETAATTFRCCRCGKKSQIDLRLVFFEKAICSCGAEFFVSASTEVSPPTATEWQFKTAIAVGTNTDDQPLTLEFINQQMKGK